MIGDASAVKVVYVYVHPTARPWRACFTVGVQSFHIAECDTKSEAKWYIKQLEKAFRNAGAVTAREVPAHLKKN